MKPSDLTVVAVRAEGTIFDAKTGEPVEANVAKLNKLRGDAARPTFYVVVTSSQVQTDVALRLLTDRLYRAGLQFDDVWCGNGLPEADLYVDEEVTKL